MRNVLAVVFLLTVVITSALAKSDLETKAGEAKKNGDFATAIQLYTEMIESNDNIVTAHFSRGMLYVYVQEYQKAVDDMDYVIENKPDFPDAWNLRGLIYTYKPDYDLAMADFDKAIELDPKFGAAYLNRAVAYIDLEDNEKALSDLNQAALFWADNPEIYYNRANIYKTMRKWQAAIDDYTSTILFSQDNAEIRYRRANCYFNLSKWDEAIADYTKALEYQPNTIDYLNNRIVAYENAGRTMEATADKMKMNEIKLKRYPPLDKIEFKTHFSSDSTFRINLPSHWTMFEEQGSYMISDEPQDSQTSPRIIGRIFYVHDYATQQGYKDPQEMIIWWEGYIAKTGDNYAHYYFRSKKDKPYKGEYPTKYFKSQVQNVENGPVFYHFDYAIAYGKHMFHMNLQTQEKDFRYFDLIIDKVVGTVRLNNEP